MSPIEQLEQLIARHNPRAIIVDNIGAFHVDIARRGGAYIEARGARVKRYTGPAVREDGTDVTVTGGRKVGTFCGVQLIDGRDAGEVQKSTVTMVTMDTICFAPDWLVKL